MAENNEVEALRRRVAELEQQLAEEREEFEWDLKAARESAEATVQKLEKQVSALQGSGGGGEDAELLAQRAMKAERRVSELEYELRKLKKEPRRSSQKDDSFLRQRAEEAEREREDLRKRLRSLERELTASREALRREQEQRQQREQELAELTASSQQREAAAGEAEKLRQRLRELEQQLQQKEERIRDLAGELNELSAADSERSSLAEERQQLQQQLQDARQRAEQLEKLNADHVEKIAELSKQVEQANNELARLKMASGQMMEQRERETERLKSDLREAEQRDVAASEQVGQMQSKLQQLQGELEHLKSERDQAVAALRAWRDRQATQVAPAPEAAQAAAADSGKDPFEENTVKATMPAGAKPDADKDETVRDGSPLGAATPAAPEAQEPPPPPLADESPEMGEPGKQPEAEPLEEDEERIAEDWLESSPQVAAGESQQSPPERQTAEANGAAGRQRRGKTGTVVVSRDKKDSGKEATTRAGVERRQSVSGGRKIPWGAVLGVAVAAGLVLVAWQFFPVWFGLGHRQAGTDGSRDQQVAVVVDAGVPANADGSAAAADQGVGLGDEANLQAAQGPGVDAGVTDAADGQEQPEQPEEVPQPTPAQLRLHKLLAKNLSRRRFARVARVAGRALEKYPRDPILHYLNGRALYALKKRRQARSELEKAVELDPGLAAAHYELVGVYLVLGNKDQACQAADRFLKLSKSGDRKARAVRRNLKKWGCR